jgi:hypothetical protein
MAEITSSVGQDGLNNGSDVRVVQELFRTSGFPPRRRPVRATRRPSLRFRAFKERICRCARWPGRPERQDVRAAAEC